MSDYVWMSTAMGRGDKVRWITHSFSHDDSAQETRLRDIIKKIDAGLPLSADEIPDVFFGAPEATEKSYNFPHLFYAYGYWLVSKAAADVLRQFDLGGGGLYPVKVFKKDRVTPVDGEWFCINFGNVKDAFLPDESPTAMLRNIRPGIKGWVPSFVVKDGDMSVSSVALAGPSIWIDESVGSAFFLSAALGDALKKAKADKGFFLKKCRVV